MKFPGFTYLHYTDRSLRLNYDPKGNKVNYTYDANHNLNWSTSAEDVQNSFTHDNYGNILTTKIGHSTNFIKASSIYNTAGAYAGGNYLKTVTDPSGNTVVYDYDETKGTLKSIKDAKDKTTYYSYNPNNDSLTDVYKTVDGNQIVNSYAYDNGGHLKRITHNGFYTTLGYNSLGYMTSVSTGNHNLLTNNYDLSTGRLTGMTYGNGQTVSYGYDGNDRVTSRSYGGNTKYTYSYDANGNPGFINDLVNGIGIEYMYDLANRISMIADTQTSLPSIAGFDPKKTTSQHFWSQMNGIKEKMLYEAEDRIAGHILNYYNINPGKLALDYTNYFTYIDSDNKRSTMTKRGNNKQKRDDLRQFSLGLVTTKELSIPLCSYVYEGNVADVSAFPKYLKLLRKRIGHYTDASDITLVYDNGSVSKKILQNSTPRIQNSIMYVHFRSAAARIYWISPSMITRR